jgi:hypothetical protein
MAAIGLRAQRVTSRRRLSLGAPLLSSGTRVAVVTAGLFDRRAVPRLGLSRHGFLPSGNAGLVLAAAGLRGQRITSHRMLGLRAPVLSSGTGVAATTATRLDRWAIRSFGLSRRGVLPSDHAGLVLAAAGRRARRITSRRRLSLRTPLLSSGTGVVTAGLLDWWAIRSFGLSRCSVLPSDNAGLVLAAAGLHAWRITSRHRLSLRAPLLSNGAGVATATRLD